MQSLEVLLHTFIELLVLAWNFRFANLKQEILAYDADILCFQEVDCFYEMSTFLKENGYIGYYKEKTAKQEGCATFYKSSKYP